MSEPLTVYVGTDPTTLVPYRVLAHSIRRHTPGPVEVVPMLGLEWGYPTAGLKCGTAFSLCRWMIPRHRDWEGRVIYLDADTVCLGDLREMVNHTTRDPDDRSVVWATVQPDRHSKKSRVQTSTMVIDCVRAAGWWGFRPDRVLEHLRKSPDDYTPFMHAAWLDGLVGVLPAAWNGLDRLEHDTKILHLTNVKTQPWNATGHPHRSVWEAYLTDAIRAGDVPKDEFVEALARYHNPDKKRLGQRGLHPHYAKYRNLYA